MPRWKILIVDDSQTDRELYRRFLQRDSHTDYEIYEEALGMRGLATCHERCRWTYNCLVRYDG